MTILRWPIFSPTASPKRRARFSAPPRASWKRPFSQVLRYNIAVLKGDQEQMDRAVGLAKEKGRGGTLDGPRGGSGSGSFRPVTGRPAVIEPGRGSSPASGGNAGRQRVTPLHEPCGKQFAGMLPKERRAPWRRSSFPRAGMSNMPPALPWRFREALLNPRRSPGFRKALPGRYFCEIYLRTGSSRVSRTGSGQARRQRGAAGNRSSV